jgi:hypothetical protein
MGGGCNGGTSKTKGSGNNDVRCDVGEGSMISLTFCVVQMFLDRKTQQLFGQGVTAATTVTTSMSASPPTSPHCPLWMQVGTAPPSLMGEHLLRPCSV